MNAVNEAVGSAIHIDSKIKSVRVVVPGATEEKALSDLAAVEPGIIHLSQGEAIRACQELAPTPVPSLPPKPEYTPEVMGFHIKRPKMLPAMCYEIRSPHYENAFYLTLVDIVLNEGTPFEERRPFEMFLNTQNTMERGWVEKATLDTSWMFQSGLDLTDQIRRWKRIEDANGGWMRKGPGEEKSVYIGSLQAEIACYIEYHIATVCVKTSTHSEDLRQKAEVGELGNFDEYAQVSTEPAPVPVEPGPDATAPAFEMATLVRSKENDCRHCGAKDSIVRTGGCPTCSECGDSKCG